MKSRVDTALIESQQPAQNGDATNATDSEYALIRTHVSNQSQECFVTAGEKGLYLFPLYKVCSLPAHVYKGFTANAWVYVHVCDLVVLPTVSTRCSAVSCTDWLWIEYDMICPR